MSEQVSLLTEQIAAVMAHNGIATPSEAFLFFDIDQDDKISVADLFEACREVQISVSKGVVSTWIAQHALQDETFLTPDAWHAALQHADGNRVLERLAEERARKQESAAEDGHQGGFQREVSATDSEYHRMRDEQDQVMQAMKLAEQQDPSAREKELQKQLQKASALLATEQKIKGSLHGGDESSSAVSASSVASSPAESAGSGEEDEMEMVVPVRAARGLSREGALLKPDEAVAIVQAWARRSFVARHGKWREEIDRKRVEAATRMQTRHILAAVRIQARARGIAARQLHASLKGKRITVAHRKIMPHVVDEETVIAMKKRHDAAIRIQAQQRGRRDRESVSKLRHEQLKPKTVRKAPSTAHSWATASKTTSAAYSENDFEHDFEDDYDDEFEDDDMPQWLGAESDAAAACLQAVCRAKMSIRDLELMQSRSKVQDTLDTIEKHCNEKRDAEKLKLDVLRKERSSNDGDVLSVQIDMLEADWAAADRHKRVLRYATERLARSLVHDLIDSVVEQQVVWRAKRERARIRQEEEQNRGYRRPRVVDVITEHIRNSAMDEILAQQQFHVKTDRWYKQRGKMLRALQEQEEEYDAHKATKTAEYIAARRAKVDKIYQAREEEKLRKQQKVASLKESRTVETAALVEFVSRQKSLEEQRVEKELKAMVALDAQRRNQMISAQVHNERMIAEKEKLHELGVKIARRKVLKEEKQEQEFQKRAQALVKQKERRNHQRKVKREQLMTLYESALQAADELKQSQSSATIRGAKDPNETLKFAIGAYFSDPSNSVVLSSTKKMMGSLMFVQKQGAGEWSEKRVEQRLKEIFKWMDKDGTGQVEQKELHGALRRLGGNIKESEVDQLLASMDADGDGQLTMEEFIDFGKELYNDHADVSGSKVLSSPKSAGAGRSRCATAEVIAANKREKEARLAAARKSKEREDLAKARKVQERKAAEEERRQFVDEAVAAYEKAMSDKTKAKDGEMKQMMQMIEEEQERRRTWFDKQWNEMRAVEDKAARSLEMSRAASSADRQGKELEEQRKTAKLRSQQETFKYEKSITAEFLVSSVESRRRMASPGFPVAIAPRQSASRVMESISSVYLAKPRKSGRLSEDGARPYTSLGFAEDPLNEASSQHHSEAGSADKQQRLRPSAHDREAALKYFIRFGTTTRLGEKLMPFYRFDRLLHAMKIAPTLLSDSDVVNIYNLARGKEGWDDVYSEPLTQPQFLRAIYHVTEWTGRGFFEMSLLVEQVEESFTNRKDWSTDLRASAYEHPLLAKSIEASNSGSLSSFAQSSLPALQGGIGLPSTPLLGANAPKSKAEYLQMRKHMKVARCTSVKASGDLPDAIRLRSRHSTDSSNFLDLLCLGDIPHEHFDDNLPSISPSDMPSQANSVLDLSASTDLNLSVAPGEKTFLSHLNAKEPTGRPTQDAAAAGGGSGPFRIKIPKSK